MKKIRIERDYRRAREKHYPPVGNQLDAIVRGFRALIDQGIKLPSETVAWVEQIERVKTRVKKPKE